MHEVEDPFKQEQVRRRPPQPCPDHHAIELASLESALDRVLGGSVRVDETALHVIALGPDALELIHDVGADELRRLPRIGREIDASRIEPNCQHCASNHLSLPTPALQCFHRPNEASCPSPT